MFIMVIINTGMKILFFQDLKSQGIPSFLFFSLFCNLKREETKQKNSKKKEKKKKIKRHTKNGNGFGGRRQS